MSALHPDPLVVARVAGAGNRFLLVDSIYGPRPKDPAGLARDVRAIERLDGVLHVDRDDSGRVHMVIYNADGSRPEACGNGLRCVAGYAVRVGHVDANRATAEFEIATDAGVRRARVVGDSVEVSMGPARASDEEELALAGDLPVRGAYVDMGNPHFVLFDTIADDATFARLGPALEQHPRFPRGANVEFVSAGADALAVRVWERGVGETAACGTGACAVAAVAVARGIARWPVAVDLPGGRLQVTDRDGELWLSGPVEIQAGAAPNDPIGA